MTLGRIAPLALPVALFLGAFPLLGPAPGPQVSSRASQPLTRADLLGVSVTELESLLVPPERIGAYPEADFQTWMWPVDGKPSPALQVVDGLVVHVVEGFDPAVHAASAELPNGPVVGQAVQRLLRARGPAEGFGTYQYRSPIDGSSSPPQPYLVYDDQWAFVQGGVVVDVTRPLPRHPTRGGR